MRCAAAKELAKKRSAAASALPALKSMMDHSDCIGEFGSFEIAQIGGIDPLIDLMRNGAPEARERVAWFLSNSVGAYPDRATELKQAFAAGLQNQDASVRQASTAGLGNLGTNGAEFLPQLMNLLNDPTPEIRLAAVDAIGKMNYVDGLRLALSNPDGQVRAAASGRLRVIAPREK